ncbi:MAG: hypothetical protein LC664_16695 [Flavobacteriales bacterium]|nr:hypothetical protein [Flavobacteriales bacterium]
MDVCEAENLGSFDRCTDVVISEFASEVTITNRVTHWCGTFNDGDSIGDLAPGEYAAEYDEVLYIFTVV